MAPEESHCVVRDRNLEVGRCADGDRRRTVISDDDALSVPDREIPGERCVRLRSDLGQGDLGAVRKVGTKRDAGAVGRYGDDLRDGLPTLVPGCDKLNRLGGAPGCVGSTPVTVFERPKVPGAQVASFTTVTSVTSFC